MINGIYPCGLDKGFGLKFFIGSRVWQETFAEGWRKNQPKRGEYSNKDEDNTMNILNDKNNHILCMSKLLKFH